MKILGDYHTHTTYSRNNHGKSTVLENAQRAKQKGLKEVAITDHGYFHKFYGVRKNQAENLKLEIVKAQESTGVKVLYGIESNILNFKGETDLDKDLIKDMDVVIMGYHSMARKHWFNGIFFHYFNYIAKIFGTTKWLRDKNTKAYLNALDKYDIDIISHLNAGVKVDVEKIAKKCVEKDVYIELNGKRLCFTPKELQIMIDSGVKFIINSDAHSAKRIADVKKPINFSIINKIPKELIYNIDNIPKFKNHGEK